MTSWAFPVAISTPFEGSRPTWAPGREPRVVRRPHPHGQDQQRGSERTARPAPGPARAGSRLAGARARAPATKPGPSDPTRPRGRGRDRHDRHDRIGQSPKLTVRRREAPILGRGWTAGTGYHADPSAPPGTSNHRRNCLLAIDRAEYNSCNLDPGAAVAAGVGTASGPGIAASCDALRRPDLRPHRSSLLAGGA
jgi:hypothetical protein